MGRYQGGRKVGLVGEVGLLEKVEKVGLLEKIRKVAKGLLFKRK